MRPGALGIDAGRLGECTALVESQADRAPRGSEVDVTAEALARRRARGRRRTACSRPRPRPRAGARCSRSPGWPGRCPSSRMSRGSRSRRRGPARHRRSPTWTSRPASAPSPRPRPRRRTGLGPWHGCATKQGHRGSAEAGGRGIRCLRLHLGAQPEGVGVEACSRVRIGYLEGDRVDGGEGGGVTRIHCADDNHVSRRRASPFLLDGVAGGGPGPAELQAMTASVMQARPRDTSRPMHQRAIERLTTMSRR